MRRRYTAHDLADYARCPRAWWYERHEAWARLDAAALAELLQARQTLLGRRARHDPEIALLARLLARQQRFAHGKKIHVLDAAAAADWTPTPRRWGCLVPLGLSLLAFLIVLGMLWP